MKNKTSNAGKCIFAALLAFALVAAAAAQKIDFSIGDTVQIPNGKTVRLLWI